MTISRHDTLAEQYWLMYAGPEERRLDGRTLYDLPPGARTNIIVEHAVLTAAAKARKLLERTDSAV